MDRREFIATAGTVAAVASTSQAFAQAMMGGGEMEESMHPPKYKALEVEAAKCVVTGNDCLRHCLGMYKMKDTSMAGCADTAFQLVAACDALAALAAVNSEHTGHLAKTVYEEPLNCIRPPLRQLLIKFGGAFRIRVTFNDECAALQVQRRERLPEDPQGG
jgi:Cys-rich four helix bundle protein (predicted Tat secretion target)